MTDGTTSILDPIATSGTRPRHSRKALASLEGKVIGFIDNGKPNFHYLVDDLGQILVENYRAASIVKHRKRGSVPVQQDVINDLSERCDAIITGSGD